MARPKVILFDVNETLLDLQPMKDGIGKLLGTGPEVVRLWFTTMLQYSLVTTVGGKYLDFAKIGEAYLHMVAKNQGVELSEDAARNAVAPMRSLPPHTDVIPTLKVLRDAKYRLVTLTNSSQAAVADQIAHAKLNEFFETLLSVEEVGKYKPRRAVYLWAARASRGGTVANACSWRDGRDVAGAAWAGGATRLRGPSRPEIFLGPSARFRDIGAGRTAEHLTACKGFGHARPPQHRFPSAVGRATVDRDCEFFVLEMGLAIVAGRAATGRFESFVEAAETLETRSQCDVQNGVVRGDQQTLGM